MRSARKRCRADVARRQIVAMLAAIRSAAVLGVDSYDVTVEVDAAGGLPHFSIVGLPVGAVKESRERVSAALGNSGFFLPPRRITVNLAPADIRKDGSAFDLPIALAVLAASGQLRANPPHLANTVFMGELGLDGSIRPVRGVLSVARRLSANELLVVPPANAAEALLARSVPVSSPGSLAALVASLARGALVCSREDAPLPSAITDIDFCDVWGQAPAKRALEIAAAGGHAVLMTGPPGAGKTMLARRLPTILPALSDAEALEVIALHSVAGLLSGGITTIPSRPFRAPHHTVSVAGLIGGGPAPRPGEVSLAHNGVLFLDELLEFPRHVLDALRQPMEDGSVAISRASGSVLFPSRFALVGAMNPCLCGLTGTPRSNECTCSTAALQKYRSRLSGPLLDRIDLLVNVDAVPVSTLASQSAGTADTSVDIRARVEGARAVQSRRFAGIPGITCNAMVSGEWLRTSAALERSARTLLLGAVDRLHLSARVYHRVMKVAMTIADLAGCQTVSREAVAEALRYRR
jgi:magnesium chelatase family protein